MRLLDYSIPLLLLAGSVLASDIRAEEKTAIPVSASCTIERRLCSKSISSATPNFADHRADAVVEKEEDQSAVKATKARRRDKMPLLDAMLLQNHSKGDGEAQDQLDKE